MSWYGSAHAADVPLSTLDVRQTISDLKLAADAVGAALVPAELVDKIPAWEALLQASSGIKDSISNAVHNTDAAVALLDAKIEKYQDDKAKLDVLQGHIDSLQAQSDQLLLFERDLEKALATLKARLDQIKEDPEVRAALELQSLDAKTDAALKRAEESVPTFLRDQ